MYRELGVGSSEAVHPLGGGVAGREVFLSVGKDESPCKDDEVALSRLRHEHLKGTRKHELKHNTQLCNR